MLMSHKRIRIFSLCVHILSLMYVLANMEEQDIFECGYSLICDLVIWTVRRNGVVRLSDKETHIIHPYHLSFSFVCSRSCEFYILVQKYFWNMLSHLRSHSFSHTYSVCNIMRLSSGRYTSSHQVPGSTVLKSYLSQNLLLPFMYPLSGTWK